jgi:hypothetical protein
MNMMNKRALTILLTIIIIVVSLTTCKKPVVETTGNISGKVIDKNTAQPIPSAEVKITGYNETKFSGSDGTFQFLDKEPKEYQISVIKENYVQETKSISVIAGQTANLDFALAPFNANISITTPLSGTKWNINSNQTITWSDNISENVKIELYKGQNPNLTISNSTPSNGSFAWSIPSTVLAGNDYKIRITSTSNSNIFGESAIFNISDLPKVKVLVPLSTTVWRTGSTQTIEWTDNIDENVNIELYKGTVLQQTIITNTESDGIYLWNLPTNLIEGLDYRIKVVSSLSSTIYAESDYFSIGKGPYIEVTPAQQIVNSSGGNTTFEIKSNVTWNALSDQSWCIISNLSGTGNSTLTVVCQKNINLTSRTSQIIISGSGVANQTIKVIQDGLIPALAITPTNYDVSKEGGSKVFTITSNIDWQVVSSQSWCTLNVSNGSSNGSVIATFNPNTTIGIRSAIITLKGIGVSDVTVTINQEGIVPFLAISPSNFDVTKEGGSKIFSITSNIDWQVSTNQSWCSLNPNNGNSNGTVIASIDPNTNVGYRTALITIKGVGVTAQTVTINQSGTEPPTLSITPSEQNVTNVAGSTTFTIISNVNWVATIDQLWCKITNPTGTGNNTITITYEGNTTNSQRIATLTITGSGLTAKTVKITQQSAIPSNGLVAYYPFNGNAKDESGNGNNGTVVGATLTTDRKGKANSAYGFNGIDNIIIIEDNDLLKPAKITLCAWVKTTEIKQFGRIIDKLQWSKNTGYCLNLETSNNTYSFGVFSSNSTYYNNKSQSIINQNEWSFLVATYENNISKIYINSKLDNILYNVPFMQHSSRYLGIGNGFDTFDDKNGLPYKGIIDDVRIYNRALSEIEILQLYNE